MKILFLLFILAFSFKGYSKESFEYRSVSIDALFSVAKNLQKGSIVNQKEWNQLFNDPAYQSYFSITGKNPAQMIGRYKTAISSKEKSKLDKIVNGNNKMFKVDLLHIKESIDRQDEIKKFILDFKKKNIFEKSVLKTLEYLPKEAKNIKNPQIDFVVVGLNAHASNLGVIIDPLFIMKFDERARIEIIAHELHHYYFDSLFKKYHKGKYKHRDQIDLLAYSAYKEGLADLIDKKYFFEHGEKFIDKDLFNELKSAFSNGGNMISTLNASIKKSKEGKNYKFERNSLMPLGGHLLGYYLAQEIQRAGKMKELISNMYTPKSIFTLYNQVAKKDRKILE